MPDHTDEELLENFILNNPELDKLENMLSQFNVLETLNIVNAELRHSNILAWLLNPNSNHGIGEHFSRQFLKHFAINNKSELTSDITIFDFELFNYSDIEIRREWNNIDILIILKEGSKKVVVAIENKIKSPEHSKQLQRYRNIIESEFKDYTRFFIYLTPESVIPSDEKWVLFKYDTVADLVDDLLANKQDLMNESVYEFIRQYSVILRRYIVGNSEIEQICRQIYKKHEKALDLIFQYRPDLDLEVSEYLQELIRQESELILDTPGKTAIRFTSNSIDNKIEKKSEGWSTSKRILLFEFANYYKRLVLRLYIGPGDQDYRNKLIEFFKAKPELFKLADRTFGKKWHAVYSKEFLKVKDYEDKDIEDLKPIINKHFNNFLQEDLRKINEYFEQKWV